jgi:hypothetical protein
MASCRRFEQVIGSTAQFYKKSQLSLTRNFLKENQDYILNIRRNFGTIVLREMSLSTNSKFFQILLKMMGKIGSKLLELEAYNCTGNPDSLSKLVKLAGNIRRLKFYQLQLKH